jgi:hypothetical protein
MTHESTILGGTPAAAPTTTTAPPAGRSRGGTDPTPTRTGRMGGLSPSGRASRRAAQTTFEPSPPPGRAVPMVGPGRAMWVLR